MVTKSTLGAQSHCGSTCLEASVTVGSSFSTLAGDLAGALATAFFSGGAGPFSGVVVVFDSQGDVDGFDGSRICSHFSDGLGGTICFTASRRASALVAPCLM